MASSAEREILVCRYGASHCESFCASTSVSIKCLLARLELILSWQNQLQGLPQTKEKVPAYCCLLHRLMTKMEEACEQLGLTLF